MSEKELLELIKKMSERDNYSSDESPSFKAYRKAEQLTDVHHISFLQSLLNK